ncbi:MAG: SpoIIE family protein phosphatase [Thermomicrobiales bacterium]|nr:SpoIIE family protein phosphatase [Thermomicrobiales bacterium]
MGLLIDIGVAKTNKYASRESGDTVEVVERPGGGISAVVCDGQGSGRAAKTLSVLVTSKAVAMLTEGVRDGAVARGVHDSLFAFRHGQVSATLEILSVDLRSNTVVATRNTVTPMIAGPIGAPHLYESDAGPIGRYHLGRPHVAQWPLEIGFVAVVVTDGVVTAGRHCGHSPIDLLTWVADVDPATPAADLAHRLLVEAIALDRDRPGDDMSVVALRLRESETEPLVRRMAVQIPLP